MILAGSTPIHKTPVGASARDLCGCDQLSITGADTRLNQIQVFVKQAADNQRQFPAFGSNLQLF